MKKLLLLVLSITFIFLNINFVSAKEFKKEIHSGVEVTLSVLATKVDIKINNKNSSEFWGYVGVWKEKNNIGNYENPLYESSGSISIPAKSIVNISVTGLDVSSAKKYYFTMTNRGGGKGELQFSTFWYGVELDDQDKDGNYEANVFGDPNDTREMLIALSKSEIPKWNELSSIELISVGKLIKSKTTSLIGYEDGVLSLPKEKNGRYYLSLVAKDSSGNYEPILQYNKNPVLFGLDKGEIFFNPMDFNKNSKTITGSVTLDKHKKTDIIPFTEITVEARILDSGTKELIRPLTSIKLKEEDGGKFGFVVDNIGLNDGTVYVGEITFRSDSGVSVTKNIEFSTDKGIIPETGEARDSFFDKNSYRLLAPIPGMTALLDPALCQSEQYKNPGVICDINAFLNFLLSLAIGAAAVVLVVKIIISGYGYMTSDIPFVKARLKSGFVESLIGLVVALSAYLILNTINPRLVNNDVKVGVAEFEVKEYPSIDIETYQKITGQPVLPKNQYVAIAQKIAQEVGVDECLVIATVSAEGAWNPRALGSDANFVLKNPTQSRRAFINSGVKYSGKTFDKNDKSLLTNKSFQDDFVVDYTKDGLGIDWRFSAGFGMMGVNFFPNGYFNNGWENNPPPLSQKDVVPALDKSFPLNPKTGKSFTPKELVIPENSFRLGALVLKQKLAGCAKNDPLLALRAYNKGGCGEPAHNEAFRIAEYKKCKGIGTQSSITPTSNSKSIFSMGDSITATTSGSTYIEKLKTDKNLSVSNQAKDGETTIWMLSKMKELEKAGKRYDFITILGGTNDILKKFNTQLTESNLNEMIKIAKKMSNKVIVISPPVQLKGFFHSTDATLIQATKDLASLNSYIRSYSGVTYVDFYSTTKNRPALIGTDGVHPTKEGQQVLFDLISKQIK